MRRKNLLSAFAVIISLLFIQSACTSEADPIDSEIKTNGTLNFAATTSTYKGEYAPDHVLAICIESSTGSFVKSLKVSAAARKNYLTNWLKAGGNTTDAVTGATLKNHLAHNCTWNGTKVDGTIVGDGSYFVCVEYTEDNSTGKLAKFAFTKGTTASTVAPVATQGVSNVSIQWTPGKQ